MFKVVPDQLRVSEGWVRCGQCNEVFDANANLHEGFGEALTPPGNEYGEGSQSIPEPAVLEAPEDPPDTAETIDVALVDPFLEVNPHALHIELQGIPVDPLESGEQQMEMPSLPVQSHHSFMQTVRLPSRWNRNWVRASLSIVGFLLVIVLILQVVVHERDRIAAMEPSAKHILEPLCAMVGCRIVPLRQIESIVIDSSSFAKVRSDVYRLSFTLKNTAQIPVATPDLELTLTDMQDQSVVRRVFSVAEFGKQQPAIEPGAELQVTLPIGVKLNGSSEKVSGYRLLSFYP